MLADYLPVEQRNGQTSVLAVFALRRTLVLPLAVCERLGVLPQRELARRLHTSQQTIVRLESPYNGSLSLRTLVELARALGAEVKVQLVESAHA